MKTLNIKSNLDFKRRDYLFYQIIFEKPTNLEVKEYMKKYYDNESKIFLQGNKYIDKFLEQQLRNEKLKRLNSLSDTTKIITEKENRTNEKLFN